MVPDRVLKALADPTRRRILQLVGQQELSVSELVACLRQPQSTVSRHLRVLREAGFLRARREGTTVLYRAPAAGRNGGRRELSARLLEWLAEEPLPRPLAARLARVLAARGERSRDFFARVGERWDQMRLEAFGPAFHLEALAALLPPAWEAADLGTGTGYLLPVLARSFRRVVAVDSVPEMLAVARARCGRLGLENVTFRQGDLEALPLGDGSVDLALAVLVLHHVGSPARVVAEIARVLRPGGRVLVVEQEAHRLAAFHEQMQDRWWGFAPGELRRLLGRAGFRGLRHRPLTVEPGRPELEVPGLYALTGEKRAAAARRGGRGR